MKKANFRYIYGLLDKYFRKIWNFRFYYARNNSVYKNILYIFYEFVKIIFLFAIYFWIIDVF